MLDLARPSKGDGPFPAVLLIHGGGFRAGNRHGYDGLCMRLAQNGYVAATVEYRLAPKYQFPAAVYDCKAAVRWLRANAAKYHIDPARVGVAGGSAGGHLALFLGVTGDVKKFDGDGGNPDQSSKVDCVVSFYGPSDFTKSYGHSKDAAEVLPLFLGGDLEKEHRRHIEASPLYWVTPNALPPCASTAPRTITSPTNRPAGSWTSSRRPTWRRNCSPSRGPATVSADRTRRRPNRR